MIRALRAIVWLRWRLLFNSIRSGRRRDRMEEVSRIFAVILPFALLALSMGTVAAVGLLGFLGGRAIATGLAEAGLVLLIVRLTLAVIFGLLFVITLASPGQVAIARYKRLLIMPIPRQTLHVIEVAANLADPWLGFVIPGLMCFALGLAIGGRAWPALIAIVAAVGIMAVFATTAALVSFLVGWLLRSRRRGEMFTLFLVLAVSMISFMPAMFAKRIDHGARGSKPGVRQAVTVEEVDRALPSWSRVLPSELYGHAIVASLDGRQADVWIPLGALALEACVLFACSSAAHKRLIDSVESETHRRRTVTSRSSMWRLPLAGPVVSAIAVTQFRTALRSVRGRLAVLLPGAVTAVLAIMIRRMPDEREFLTNIATQGHYMLAFGMVFALYALQPFSMNLFGTDRSGLIRIFLVPATDLDVARGKVAGCGLIFAMSAAVATLMALVVAPGGSIGYWMAVVFGGAATFLLMSPINVALSAWFPVAADISKTGTGGNPHPVPMLGGTILVLVAAAPAAFLFIVNALWLQEPLLLAGLLSLWLVLAIAVSVPALRLVSQAVGSRRENLALIAQDR